MKTPEEYTCPICGGTEFYTTPFPFSPQVSYLERAGDCVVCCNNELLQKAFLKGIDKGLQTAIDLLKEERSHIGGLICSGTISLLQDILDGKVKR